VRNASSCPRQQRQRCGSVHCGGAAEIQRQLVCKALTFVRTGTAKNDEGAVQGQRRHHAPEQIAVALAHEQAGRDIVHRPQAHHHRARTGGQQAAREVDDVV
jgi:hypothetical protein